MRTEPAGRWLWLALLVGAALRLDALGYGLPAVFNADEPHHVNVAISFGRGSLNPQVFKYPTLWMYALFAAYAAYFLGWSGFGLLRSARDFGKLFVWEPGGFYWIARSLSASFSLAGLPAVYRAGRLLGGASLGLWAAALLAVSPTLVVSAHAAKPDSMMFFLAACAWWAALAHAETGRPASLLACAAAAGLAASTQYTAAPLGLTVLAAWAVGRERSPKTLALAAAAGAAAFLAGSPFILLDWPAFRRDMGDQAALALGGGTPAWRVLENAVTFAGSWKLGAPLLLIGAAELLRRDRRRAFLLLAPAAVNMALLLKSVDGGWQRYLLAMFPAFALVAAFGVETVFQRVAARLPLSSAAAALCVLPVLMLPGLLESRAFDRELSLPDTRILAARWIEAHVPQGARVLADQEHASPPLRYSRAFVEKMLQRTRESGHPRSRQYELMLESHPGGGYEVIRLEREAASLHSGKWHTAWSAQGRATFDPAHGVQGVREAGIGWVVLTTGASTPDVESDITGFAAQVSREGRLMAEFLPSEGETRGPALRVYEIQGGRP